MIWSDTNRFHPAPLDKPVSFPNPENYDNLDKFTTDMILAVEQEKQFRKQHKLNTFQARYEYHLDRQAEFYFDVI